MTDTIVYQHIGSAEPTIDVHRLKINDYWLDTTGGGGVLKKCASISPITWDTIVSGGGSAEWGYIGGTLSAQTDLNNAFGGKEPANANIQTHVTSQHAPSGAQVNADITKAEIEAKLTGAISSHTHSGGSDSEITVLKVGDTSNATTTYADATGLSFTPLADKEYIIEAWIRYTTTATTVGIKLSCNGPSGQAFVSSLFNSALVTSGMSGGGGNAYNTGVATASAQATTDNLAMLNILFKNGSNATIFIIRFAAETTGTITIKDGSVLRYRQVN